MITVPILFSDSLGGGQISEYFLFIGRTEKIKGMDILLQVFAEMPTEQLIIAGTGSRFEEYKSKASENVQFVGFLDRDSLIISIRNAKAVLVPSQWYETFGLVIIEAYAAHTPAIVGNIGNIASLVDHGKTGLKFQYNSSESLRNTIITFKEANRVVMKNNAYIKFQNEFAPDGNYSKLMEIYASICENE